MGLFGDATFSGGNAVGLLINFGFYGELFVINLCFQQVLGYSALLAGLALLLRWAWLLSDPCCRAGSLLAPAVPRPTMLIGLLIGGAGLFGLTIAGAHTPYPLLILPLVAAGFGMSFTMPAATTAVVEGAPAERAGLASGAINASRQVGGVIGVALLGALVSGGAAFIPGLRVALIIAGAAFLTGAALTAVTVRQRPAGPGG